MPVRDTDICPYCAEWPSIDEESGKLHMRRLHPEEVAAEVALGFTTIEICDRHKAPRQAVEHVISMIPFMMAWRDAIRPYQPGNSPPPETQEEIDLDPRTVFHGPERDTP